MKKFLEAGQLVEDEEGNKYETTKGDFIELNSDFELTDVSLVQKLVDFIRLNPFPLDEQLHDFAESNNLEPSVVEQYAYAMLTVILCGGKSKGNAVGATTENLNIGNFIENEHVSMDSTNPVVREIQKVFICKIRNDHNAEDATYYSGCKDFKAELEQEQGSMTEKRKLNRKR